jgi:aspartokinase
MDGMQKIMGVVIIDAGPEFREQPGVAGRMCAVLAAAGIDILAMSTSFSAVSCVVASDRLADAVTALKEAFDLF